MAAQTFEKFVSACAPREMVGADRKFYHGLAREQSLSVAKTANPKTPYFPQKMTQCVHESVCLSPIRGKDNIESMNLASRMRTALSIQLRI